MRSSILAAVAALALASASHGVAFTRDLPGCLTRCGLARGACDSTCRGPKQEQCMKQCAQAQSNCEDSCRSGGYVLDANGKCHDPHGRFAPAPMCRVVAPVCNPAKSKPCGNSCIAKGNVCHVG
jgi:hypothetical protein